MKDLWIVIMLGFFGVAGWNFMAKNWIDMTWQLVVGSIMLVVMWLFDKVDSAQPDTDTTGQQGKHSTRPQAGLSKYSSEYDHEVWRALEIEEQRKSGRQRGGDITVSVSKGRGWDTWRAGAEIWEDQQIGASDGVYVEFEDPGDVPTYNEFGALVPRSKS